MVAQKAVHLLNMSAIVFLDGIDGFVSGAFGQYHIMQGYVSWLPVLDSCPTFIALYLGYPPTPCLLILRPTSTMT